MNLIFCTSPFQVLVAKEIIKSVGGDFHGIYLSTSKDIRHAHYSKELESVCFKFSRIDYDSAKLFLDTFEGTNIKAFYLASLDNETALSLYFRLNVDLFTFDDGSTSVIPFNLYTEELGRIVYKSYTIQDVFNSSKAHFTVFEDCSLFSKDKQIKLSLDLKPTDFERAKNGKSVNVFLGQFLGSMVNSEDYKLTELLTNKALRSLGDCQYYSHPRVKIKSNFSETRTVYCFEEEIYNLLRQYEFVNVYSFYSTSLLTVKNIPGVSVTSFNTLLNCYESNLLKDLGVNQINLSVSDSCVDIVLPVYKGEKTIKKSIESVLNQTYSNFNLIIVDDCSTDGTSEICKSYLFDDRVSYIRLSERKGISHALNKGISSSNAHFIARQDADDIWLPWHLDLLIYKLEQVENLELIGSKVDVDYTSLPMKLDRGGFGTLCGEDLWLVLAYKNVFNHSTVVFKRSAYLEAGGYDSACDGFEDWHLWSRIMTKDNSCILDTVTAFYRLSEFYENRMRFRTRLAKSRGLTLDEVMI